MAEEVKEKPGKELRHIVRIVNKDLDGNKALYRALLGLKGVGQRYAKIVALAFEKETGVSYDAILGEMSEEMDSKLEDIIVNPQKHGIPSWTLNRRNDWQDGGDLHLVMGELDFAIRKDVQRLGEIKSYRGLRHAWRLPVRGQRTRSTHRGKGIVVGVMKKDAKGGKSGGSKIAKPAKAAKPAAKKGKGKK